MKECIKAKRELLRSWRKALAAFSPKRAAPKKRVEGFQRKSVTAPSS